MDYKKKRSDEADPQVLGQGMARVYAAKQWQTPWRLYWLSRQWPAIVGTEVARLTSPAFFRQDTLWMYVQDSAWMHHLQFIKQDLLLRVNRVLTEEPIIDIRWQLKPLFPDPPARLPPPPLAIDPERLQAFAQLSRTVANPECREALQRLWRIFAARSDKEQDLPAR